MGRGNPHTKSSIISHSFLKENIKRLIYFKTGQWTEVANSRSGKIPRFCSVGVEELCGVKLWLCNFFFNPNAASLLAKAALVYFGFNGVLGMALHWNFKWSLDKGSFESIISSHVEQYNLGALSINLTDKSSSLDLLNLVDRPNKKSEIDVCHSYRCNGPT